MGWSRVPHTENGALDPDLFEAVRCFEDVSTDFLNDVDYKQFNRRLGQTNKTDQSSMCEVWVWRQTDNSNVTLAIALDRSLDRDIPNDPNGTPRFDAWVVNLGISSECELPSEQIYRIFRGELVSRHHPGKNFALLWHARKTSAFEELNPDGSRVDKVIEEMLKESPTTLVLVPEIRPFDAATQIDAVEAWGHYKEYLQSKARNTQVRFLRFTLK